MFCTRNEAPPHFKPPPSIEYLDTSAITSHCTDSFRVKPITLSHPISKISIRLTIFLRRYLKDRVCENNPQQERTSSERNQTDCTRNSQSGFEQFYCLSCCCAVMQQRGALNKHSIDY